MSILLFISSSEFISIMHWIVSNPTWFFINVCFCFIINILLGTFIWLIVVVQLLSCVWLFATPWPAACQASLSFTVSLSLLKLMSIESVMPSNHLILCRPLLLLSSVFPSIRVCLMSRLFPLGGQSIGASASASVLPMNNQCWFNLGWTGLISVMANRLSTAFSNTTVQ